MRFHLKDPEVARDLAHRLRGALKDHGHPRTHTKRLAAAAAMLGYGSWPELLACCPATEPPSAFDDELDRDTVTRRARYHAGALARAAHVPTAVAVAVVAEVRPTKRSGHPLVVDQVVPGHPRAVFDHFVGRIGRWWPASFTFGLAELAAITIEPRPGGRWYETATTGAEVDWGVVTVFEPGRRVGLTFQISATRTVVPRDQGSEILVEFADHPDGCAVRLTHSQLHKHGTDAATVRANMASEHGWPFILRGLRRDYQEG